MALRTKTIEYPFTQRTTSLTAATRHDFAAETIYIPETTSRTFRSVFIEVTFLQDNTVATNLTSVLLGIKLGATAFSDTTTTQTFTNTGEINGFGPFTRDVTSYFTSNFGGAGSQTCQVGVQVGGASTINHTAKLIITYEYDDTDTTHVKTVRLPIESATGALTTSYVEIGTDQIPALTGGSGLLPEASITIRQIWFEVEADDNSAGTTDYQHGLRLDAGGSDDLDGNHESFDSASKYFRRIWRPTISNTTVAHKIYSRTTNATSGPCHHQAIVMYVTYEFDASSTTTVLNSVMLAVGGDYCIGATASGDVDAFQLEYLANEPTTLTLKQSGVYLTWMCNVGGAVSVAVGGQTARTYSPASSTTEQSSRFACHRFDGGAAQGSGHTLAQGYNTITVKVYTNNGNTRVIDGVVLLNYTSGVASGGVGSHNHTTRWLARSITTTAASPFAFTQLAAPTIPETAYYLSNVGFVPTVLSTGGATSSFGVAVNMELQSGEGNNLGLGWVRLYSGVPLTDAELMPGANRFYAEVSSRFNRYPGDPLDLCDVEAASRHYSFAWVTGIVTAELLVTYSAITVTKSGTVSRYADADGAGLTVELWERNHSPKRFVGTATTTTGGAWSFTWYNPAADGKLTPYVFEDSSHVGAGQEV